MFVRIDNNTLVEKIISSEEMAAVLEEDMKSNVVDDTLTDLVLGTYEHSNRLAHYKYITKS